MKQTPSPKTSRITPQNPITSRVSPLTLPYNTPSDSPRSPSQQGLTQTPASQRTHASTASRTNHRPAIAPFLRLQQAIAHIIPVPWRSPRHPSPLLAAQ